ncbi:MAG: penicillin-binding transpeptidase domain-containing protein [Patescibacteria group bacterium]
MANNKKEIFLEEAVLDDLAQDFDAVEMPLSERAFKLVAASVVIVIFIVIARILFLGFYKGDFYANRALGNAGRITAIRAERGIILDRFNKPLVKNEPAFRLNLKISEILKDSREKEEAFKSLEEILNIPADEIGNLIRQVDLEKQNSITIATDLSIENVIKFKDLNLRALEIEDDFKREYLNPEIFAHILGYTGIASKDNLAQNSEISLNDIIGKTGLESFYNKELKGQDGHFVIYKNARGETIGDKLLNEPQPGYGLLTTIDSEFQIYFYNRLKQGLISLGRQSGVGLAINPRTGEVLALISLPSFNNNKITSEILTDSSKPLFNRAVSGVYNPGSTIKPLVALAALSEGVINTTKEIFSAGYIEVPNPYYPDKPSRFLDWKPHGWVNLYSAIARSSNVYFYSVGGGFGDIKGLGIEKLKEYWQKFGFNEKTGIDLPAESQGFLPDPEEKEKRTGEIWRIGDTYNVSIGQGDIAITPLELLNYIAAIAANGKSYRPFVVKKIISENGEVIREAEPKINWDHSGTLNYFNEVQKGMVDAVQKPYGTAYLLSGLPISAAAKTGTAQIEGNTKINALFVGYLPAAALAEVGAPLDKQIAILILIENAPEGIVSTVPIAKDVLGWYYENRL